MNKKTLTLLAVGDIIPSMPNPENAFALVAPTLKSADILIGQGEVPFTTRPAVTAAWSGLGYPDAISRVCDPKNISSLNYAGFHLLHLAGNHIWDAGVPGVEDTINELKKHGIATVGAGMNIDEARAPVIINRNGTRFGFLSYNCVGPRETYANPLKPGCAWIHVLTCYEMDHPTTGGIPAIYTFAEPKSLAAMIDDVKNLRSHCDILIVHFHKGVGMTPVRIALYEQAISYAAIDNGADLILSEHAHILKGIEIYKGKTIYHGLGHFIMPLGAPISPEGRPKWLLEEEERRARESMGLIRGPDCPTWPMHPDNNMNIIAKCIIEDNKICQTRFLPVLNNKRGQPEILKNDERGKVLFDYMTRITTEAELNARFTWDGDEILIS